MAEEVTSLRTRSPRTSPTRRDLASVLFRQRRPLCLSFVILLVGFLLYAILTRSYTAEMKILVRRGRVDLPMSAEPSLLPLRYDVTEEELNSEAELLRDTDSATKVVSTTGLDRRLGWRPWRNSPEARLQRATDALIAHLRVEPLRKTRLVKITYQSSDRQLAADVLRSVVSVYMEKHLASHRPSGEFDFFERQATLAGERVTAHERDLLRSINQGLVEPTLQRDLALQKLAESEASYRQLLVSITEKERRIIALKKELSAEPERVTTEVRRSDNPQLLEKLKSTLLTLELRRTELSTRYQPDYRLVQEVDKQIQQTREAIAGEALDPVRDESSNRSTQYEWAKSELEQSEIDVESLRARAAGLARVVLDYNTLSRQLGRAALANQEILRETKNAEGSYELLSRKREEARIGDALDERHVLNAVVVQQPFTPAGSKPSLLSMAAIGIFLASAVSTGVAFASDALDPTFRFPQEITRYLDTPVLASLPSHWQSSLPGDSA